MKHVLMMLLLMSMLGIGQLSYGFQHYKMDGISHTISSSPSIGNRATFDFKGSLHPNRYKNMAVLCPSVCMITTKYNTSESKYLRVNIYKNYVPTGTDIPPLPKQRMYLLNALHPIALDLTDEEFVQNMDFSIDIENLGVPNDQNTDTNTDESITVVCNAVYPGDPYCY